MGFWHTGYFEFHEPTGERSTPTVSPPPPTFTCPRCAVSFRTARDLQVHRFQGHALDATIRPVLVFRGRECGRSRLTVTSTSEAGDWLIRDADKIEVNGEAMPAEGAAAFLADQRLGVAVVRLQNKTVRQSFEFEFALAEESDLQGVDGALDRLIASGELSVRSIDDFIQRSRTFPSAAQYMAGLANYLYGALDRESVSSSVSDYDRGGAKFQGKYDQAVATLGRFDREPAEAICGLVAFHYNQFERAASKTHSERVSEVALRLRTLLDGQVCSREDLAGKRLTSMDHALSDTSTEEILLLTAMALDGTGEGEPLVAALAGDVRPEDELKLRLVAAEHFRASGDVVAARQHAAQLRHGRTAEVWYERFMTQESK